MAKLIKRGEDARKALEAGVNTSRLTVQADDQCYVFLSGRTNTFTRTAGKDAIIFSDSLTVAH